MSKIQALNAHARKRSGSGAINSLRREGLIPAVVYGKTTPSFNIRLNRKEVEKVLHHSASEQILVHLTIEDTKETLLALIQDVQHNPLTDKITHIDFHAIREDENIHARVPLELVGDCPGVRAGGLLEHLIHTLEIKCLPKNLPETIAADVTGLELNGVLHIRDLKLPEGVKASANGDIIVAIVSEPKVAAETAAPAAEAKPAEPKGKAPAAAAKAAPAAAAKAPAKK